MSPLSAAIVQAPLRRNPSALGLQTLLLGCLLWALAVAPARSQEPADADGGDQFFDSAGVSIRYVSEGAGDPVVLIHGFTSSLEANWKQSGLFDRLKQDFQVIAIDARGHGKSGKPHEPEAYGDEMALDVLRLLDHLGLSQAHVVGYSMGGFITMRILAIAPDRLLSAVVAGAGWGNAETQDPAMFEALADSLDAGTGITPLIRALTPEGQPLPNEQQLQMMNQMILASNDPKALAAAIRGMSELEITEEQLRENSVPTLGIVGSLDPIKAAADALVGVMTDYRLELIEGADHMTAVGRPELAEQMRDFFIELCRCA